MAGSADIRPDQSLCAGLAPMVTDNSGISKLAPATTQVDASYHLKPVKTPKSRNGSEFAAHQKLVCSPITPSSQPSPMGAKFGRTPLPNAPPPSQPSPTGEKSRCTPLPSASPAPSTESESSSDVALSRLDCLAIAASKRKPSPKHRQRASPDRQRQLPLRKYIEQVMTEQNHPMKSQHIHQAVNALTADNYQIQSVRKALCEKEAQFEPLNNLTWALKSWGLAPSKMPRKFGTGGGTMAARAKRAAAV
ncbi:hypothetical protein V493_04615 [Pseudogymnoascus sp. VKM F-4281 (FW-2241)]|nr:hypothetical protein V493_04615 [Pseudogymnoascus sp. VKM F-4281 (FW-2241)]